MASSAISDEVKITDRIYFKSLKDTPESWAEEVIKLNKAFPHKADTKIQIVKNEYDIEKNAIDIQQFYLEQYKSAYCDVTTNTGKERSPHTNEISHLYSITSNLQESTVA